MLVDRRLSRSPKLVWDSEEEGQETYRRLKERWAYDEDDEPAVGPEGQDESSRKLVDDFSHS
jgi:enhancer of polycomb-like protein